MRPSDRGRFESRLRRDDPNSGCGGNRRYPHGPVFWTQWPRRNCYGNGTANPSLDGTTASMALYCYDPTNSYKGTHAYPYRYQVWAYDLNDFAEVKAGTKQPWDVVPYGVWSLNLPTPESTGGPAGLPTMRSVSCSTSRSSGPIPMAMPRPLIHTFRMNATRPRRGSLECRQYRHLDCRQAGATAGRHASHLYRAADRRGGTINTSGWFRTAPRRRSRSTGLPAIALRGRRRPRMRITASACGCAAPATPPTCSRRDIHVSRHCAWDHNQGDLGEPDPQSRGASITVHRSHVDRDASRRPHTASIQVADVDGTTTTVAVNWSPTNSFIWTPSTANPNYQVNRVGAQCRQYHGRRGNLGGLAVPDRGRRHNGLERTLSADKSEPQQTGSDNQVDCSRRRRDRAILLQMVRLRRIRLERGGELEFRRNLCMDTDGGQVDLPRARLGEGGQPTRPIKLRLRREEASSSPGRQGRQR